MNKKPHTAETKARISAKLKGQAKSAETCAKMKAAWKLRPTRKICWWAANAVGWTSGCGQVHTGVITFQFCPWCSRAIEEKK